MHARAQTDEAWIVAQRETEAKSTTRDMCDVQTRRSVQEQVQCIKNRLYDPYLTAALTDAFRR